MTEDQNYSTKNEDVDLEVQWLVMVIIVYCQGQEDFLVLFVYAVVDAASVDFWLMMRKFPSLAYNNTRRKGKKKMKE